jgi:acetyl esterase
VEVVPAQLHSELAALLPRLSRLLTPPAREVGLDRARSRFSELLAAGATVVVRLHGGGH